MDKIADSINDTNNNFDSFSIVSQTNFYIEEDEEYDAKLAERHDEIVKDRETFLSSTPLSFEDDCYFKNLVDLKNYTPQECQVIINVLKKDQQLRKVEEFRLNKLACEIQFETNKEKIFYDREKFNQSHCFRCFSNFIILINPRRVCIVCKYQVCKKCSQLIKKSFLSNGHNGAASTNTISLIANKNNDKVYICFACYKQRLLEANFIFKENLNNTLKNHLNNITLKYSSISSISSSKFSEFLYDVNYVASGTNNHRDTLTTNATNDTTLRHLNANDNEYEDSDEHFTEISLFSANKATPTQ